MGVIGTIGQFLIDYQDTIGVVVLIAFALLLLILLISLIVKNAKRKKAVAARDKLIDELLAAAPNNQAVLSVIAKYNAGQDIEETKEATKEVTKEVTKEATEETTKEATEEAGTEKPQREEQAADMQQAGIREPELQKAEPARAYGSRDAGIDKHGNVYTESMLKEQIG